MPRDFEIGKAWRGDYPPATPSSSSVGLDLFPAPLEWGGTGLLLPPPGAPKPPPFSLHPRIRAMLEIGAPTSFDLSPLSGGIYNQGQFPRCSSYSSAGIKSYEERVRDGSWFTFDPDTLFREGGGSDQSGGSMEAMAQVALSQGVIRQDTGQRYKIANFLKARTDPAGFREDVKAAIAVQKPVQLAALLPVNFGWNSSGGATNGYHAMCACGYDDTWLIVQNSWGSQWGNQGFGRFPWSYLEQGNFLNGYNYALVWTDVGGSGPPPPPNPTPTPNPTDEVSQVLAIHNTYRQQAGLQPLTLQSQLTAAAQGYAQTLSTWTGFDHTGPDGSTPFSRMKAAGYSGGTMGENIARGFATPTDVMTAWKNSPGHWANVLYANYRHVGIGIASGPQGKSWVCDFGAGGSDSGPSPPPPPPPPTGPQIVSVSPNPVALNATLVIGGTAFGSRAGSVSFASSGGVVPVPIPIPGPGASAAQIVSWSDTSVQVTVPADAITGTLTLAKPSTTGGGSTTAQITIGSGPPPPPPAGDPAITSWNPDPVSIGGTFTILGSGFGATPGVVGFTFHVGAQVQSWSDTQIVCTVPVGATLGVQVFAVQRATDQKVAFNKVQVVSGGPTPTPTPTPTPFDAALTGSLGTGQTVSGTAVHLTPMTSGATWAISGVVTLT